MSASLSFALIIIQLEYIEIKHCKYFFFSSLFLRQQVEFATSTEKKKNQVRHFYLFREKKKKTDT